MRVLNPGPGEVVDRLTIVARKIVEGGEKAEHFHKEMDELLSCLETMEMPVELVPKEFGKALHLLSATNAALWQREDELRAWRARDDMDSLNPLDGRLMHNMRVLAFRIQELNDLRNKLVQQLNAAAGVVREEKL